MTVSPNTIPSLITALSFSNFSKVIVKTNTFNGQSDLKELRFEKIKYFIPTKGKQWNLFIV